MYFVIINEINSKSIGQWNTYTIIISRIRHTGEISYSILYIYNYLLWNIHGHLSGPVYTAFSRWAVDFYWPISYTVFFLFAWTKTYLREYCVQYNPFFLSAIKWLIFACFENRQTSIVGIFEIINIDDGIDHGNCEIKVGEKIFRSVAKKNEKFSTPRGVRILYKYPLKRHKIM